jgi:transcriptional regulator with XRE-family HTH domain
MPRKSPSPSSLPPAARRIVGLRLQSGLSQKAFAATLGLTDARWGRYERGETEPNFDILATLRRTYGVDLNALICGPAPATQPEIPPVEHPQKRHTR